MASKKAATTFGAITPPEPIVETATPDEDGALTPPDELADEVEEIVDENEALGHANKDLKEEIKALKGEPAMANLDLKTLAEIVNDNAKKNPNGDDPAYVTGDGFVFAAERYSNALEHVRNKKGLKIYHVEKGANGWKVKP